MKGLMRYLSPFAPDQSGACAVFYELGGIIIIIDAGGCTGNVCGFDEPRWFIKKSAVYSAGLRDMDAILGRDDMLIEKAGDAVKTMNAESIALIGTPVPAVIATDLNSIKREIEQKYGLPAVAVDTKGMDTYEKGQEKAYEALLELSENRLFTERMKNREINKKDALVWGMTPLDAPSLASAEKMKKRIMEETGLQASVIGMNGGLEDILSIKSAKVHYCVSPSAYRTVKKICDTTGAEMKTGFFPDRAAGIIPEAENAGDILIVHQQVLANDLRNALRKNGAKGRITAASFFTMQKELMEEGDLFLPGEKEFTEAASAHDTVIGDPLLLRALKGSDVRFIPFSHYAVSGGMYSDIIDAGW